MIHVKPEAVVGYSHGGKIPVRLVDLVSLAKPQPSENFGSLPAAGSLPREDGRPAAGRGAP